MENRIIKFRVWDTDLKIWINNIGMKKDNVLTDGTEKRFVVNQFTGLKDKNGKPIFEGDIIKWKFVNTGEEDHEEIFEYTEPVEWNECGFFLDGGAPLTVAMDDCEVIGNIFQNPELLTR